MVALDGVAGVAGVPGAGGAGLGVRRRGAPLQAALPEEEGAVAAPAEGIGGGDREGQGKLRHCGSVEGGDARGVKKCNNAAMVKKYILFQRC